MEKWEAEAVQLRQAKPRHLLFLCVANSARSQMAEGIARHLAPAQLRISSAGSAPGRLNPLAVQALAEVGIDISKHFSKALDQVDAGSVDAVITLCADEVCPVFPGHVRCFHWALPDPVGIEGFRAVRDELMRRLPRIF